MIRILDATLSLLGLVALVPLFVIIALATKFGDGGPVLYRQSRLGKAGRPFVLLKFRSMSEDADRTGPHFTAPRDARVTKVGAVLRRYSVDELPQLLNVLRGDMSLIGPRPILERQASKYDDEDLALRLSVRPGLSGLAQVRNRHDTTFEARLKDDLEWVANRGLTPYLILLWQTLMVTLKHRSY